MTAYCSGYLQGARLHETWTRDNDAVLHLFVFAAVAGEVEDEIHGPDDKPLADPEAWLQARREQVGRYVQDLRDYWASRRVAARSAPKTGRNDPRVPREHAGVARAQGDCAAPVPRRAREAPRR